MLLLTSNVITALTAENRALVYLTRNHLSLSGSWRKQASLVYCNVDEVKLAF